MPKSTEFLAQPELLKQLRITTQGDVKTYNQLLKRLERDKQNVKFLAKRIKQSNQVLTAAGQEPVSLEYIGSLEEPTEDTTPAPEQKGKLKQAWERIPNLAETKK